MGGSRKFRFWWGRGAATFLENLYREAFGPTGSNCFSRKREGVITSISKEIYIATCDFSGGLDPCSPPPPPPPPPYPLDLPIQKLLTGHTMSLLPRPLSNYPQFIQLQSRLKAFCGSIAVGCIHTSAANNMFFASEFVHLYACSVVGITEPEVSIRSAPKVSVENRHEIFFFISTNVLRNRYHHRIRQLVTLRPKSISQC